MNVLKNIFSNQKQIHLHQFSIDNYSNRNSFKKNIENLLYLLTASTNYLFGQLQLRLFRIIQQYMPSSNRYLSRWTLHVRLSKLCLFIYTLCTNNIYELYSYEK